MMILNPYIVFSTALSHFEAVFDTTKISTGSSSANTITLPLTNTDGLSIDWGDGTIDSSTTHTYSTEGIKTVKIEGNIYGWRFNNTGDVLKLIEIKSWGNFFITADATFYGCSNLIMNNVNGKPSIISASLASMFRGCSEITTINNISSWDLSSVTDISSLFANCVKFNQGLSKLDVSNIRIMYAVFLGATVFNGNISGWNVSNVTNMHQMFYQARGFNQNISGWNVSNVTTMYQMFSQASVFNQNIGSWDVSNVKDIGAMFNLANAFNQNIGSWDVSNVTSASNFMNSKTPATFSASNLDAIYNGWSTRTLKTGVAISFGSAKHTTASQAGRNILTNTYGWTITDGGI